MIRYKVNFKTINKNNGYFFMKLDYKKSAMYEAVSIVMPHAWIDVASLTITELPNF